MASETIRTPIVELTFSSSFQRPGCVNETANRLRTGLHGGPALDLQRNALQQAGCHVIYEEAASGKNASRLEFEQCRKALPGGYTLRLGAET
jgi:DNA invertase Pin-like site-specific DNA recombinase